MGFTALLCLLSAFSLTTQDLVSLIVSPTVAAECDQQVTLSCNVSSYQHELSVLHMEWSQDKTQLCTVDDLGEVTKHSITSLSNFQCEYNDGRLSLTFPHVQPLNSGKYRCKLRSTQGAHHEYTRVTLKECCGKVEGLFMSDNASCTFHRVHPDGEVHWFHGSHNLSEGSVRHYTTKNVDNKGYLTIHSYLKRKSSNVPYNCSLKSTRSGRYIASTLVENALPMNGEVKSNGPSNSSRSQEPMGIILCILILLAAVMK